MLQDWLTLGRLCSPRVLFYFEQRPPDTEVGNLKSLQHLMEDQIYRLLRKCRIITNIRYYTCVIISQFQSFKSIVLIVPSTNSLFAIPSNQEFVFFPSSKQKDRFDFLLDLLNENFELETEPADFREFLDEHIELAQSKGTVHLFLLNLSVSSRDLRLHFAGFSDNVGRHAGPSIFVV